MMQHRLVSGRIAYTSKKPEMQGQSRGFETFTFSHHGDGSVILRAHCEIAEPEPTVMREIVYALGPGGRPRNLHVHLTLGDAFLGSGWINASEHAGGGLLDTLVTFLDQGLQVEAAARALFVHANTVRYRLKRIHEVTGYSPTDPRDGYALRLALTLGRLRR